MVNQIMTIHIAICKIFSHCHMYILYEYIVTVYSFQLVMHIASYVYNYERVKNLLFPCAFVPTQ